MTSSVACGRGHFHDIYIEHTTRFKFKTSTNVVAKEGWLSKKWKTKSCSCVELGADGIYVAYNLDISPHWSASRQTRKEIAKQIKLHTKTSVQVISRQKSFSASNDLLAVNSSNEEWVHIRNQFNAYPWQDIAQELMTSTSNRSRGNLAKHRGYTALDIKAKAGKPVTFPSFLRSTDARSVQRMTLATSLMRTLYTHFGMEFPYKENAIRAKEFSLNLYTSFNIPPTDENGQAANCLEFCTDAISVIPDPGKSITICGKKSTSPTKSTAILTPAIVLFGLRHLSCTST